ncbi:MAG TPA: hypothetical protein VMU28_10695 [Terriglobales bacterium]|nr:hypothetical protein [Terriglobales bacterium]
MKRVRAVTEAEVISEFLKNEFYHEEFHRDREQFERLVLFADITCEEENALRRALLFRRRGHMWRELPADTQWWEMQLEPHDLCKLRVFPRAHWRKVSQGSFALSDIVHRIRTRKFSGRIADFIAKIHVLSYQLRHRTDLTSVILIAEDENSAVTIIEGNHRLTAAMLSNSEKLHERFRVFVGMSPHMNEVCWYNGSVSNLWRYAKNRLKHLWRDKDADLRHLPVPAPVVPQASYAEAVGKVVSESK